MDDDPHLTIGDFRRLYCVTGTMSRMREAGIDARDFVRNGLPASRLMGHGYDGMVERVIEAKRAAERPVS